MELDGSSSSGRVPSAFTPENEEGRRLPSTNLGDGGMGTGSLQYMCLLKKGAHRRLQESPVHTRRVWAFP